MVLILAVQDISCNLAERIGLCVKFCKDGIGVIDQLLCELFGFFHREELEFFELLIGISGIGPKSALGVMALAPLDTLKRAIAAGEITYLTKVSGIGKKMAQKIILELREKLAGEAAGEAGELAADADVLEALISLGYSRAQARGALQKIPSTIISTNDRIKEAIKILGR